MFDSLENQQWLKKLELKTFPEPPFITLRHPVLLCHGYGAFASLVKPSPLYDIALWIRGHGVPAFAPNIVPYATIETRAEEWKKLLQLLSEKYDYPRYNIIAHSMGGLDIRYALSELDIAGHVESFTTVSTPHHGTSLAELVLKTPDTFRETLGGFFDWMGDRVYPKTKSDAIGSIRQLTRTYMKDEFNKQIKNPDSIPCYSYSAAVGKGTDTSIETVLRLQQNHIYEREGLNDAFVSVQSATWGDHIETVAVSHIEQMNLRTRENRASYVKSFWERVLRMLKEKGH